MYSTTFLKRTFIVAFILPLVFSMGCKNRSVGQDEWQNLFNGVSLDGWKVVGGEADFYVEDSMIVCNTKLDIEGGYLVTEKSYDNFILELCGEIILQGY